MNKYALQSYVDTLIDVGGDAVLASITIAAKVGSEGMGAPRALSL